MARKKKYTVKYNDDAFSIAKQFGTSADAVVKANPGMTKFNAGTVVNVPVAKTPPPTPPQSDYLYNARRNWAYKAPMNYGSTVSRGPGYTWANQPLANATVSRGPGYTTSLSNQQRQQAAQNYHFQSNVVQPTWDPRYNVGVQGAPAGLVALFGEAANTRGADPNWKETFPGSGKWVYTAPTASSQPWTNPIYGGNVSEEDWYKAVGGDMHAELVQETINRYLHDKVQSYNFSGEGNMVTGGGYASRVAPAKQGSTVRLKGPVGADFLKRMTGRKTYWGTIGGGEEQVEVPYGSVYNNYYGYGSGSGWANYIGPITWRI